MSIPELQPARMNRDDHKRAWLITAIYLIVAFIWLGSFRSPQTGWVPDQKGDHFVVDFGREVSIDRTLLFGGLGPVWGCFGALELEAWDGSSYQPFQTIEMNALFRWHGSLQTVTTDKLRITARAQAPRSDGSDPGYWKAEYRELSFFSGTEQLDNFIITDLEAADGTERLFDEQALVPFRPSVLHSTYFDEVYFPRTALEQLLDWPVIYENTHPPLGKDIMQVGIAIMGMTPFGWRWLGTLAGALMLPLMYAMAKRLFRHSGWATFCTLLMAADFMHFTQTRIGTVDSYLVFFVMAAFHFMLKYVDEPSYEKGFWKSLPPLAMSGLFLGLAGAVKWVGFFAAFGLALLFFLSRVWEYKKLKRDLNRELASPKVKVKAIHGWLIRHLYLTCLLCMIFFILIPAVVYTLSYLPVPRHGDERPFLEWVVESQQNMFNYHKGVTASHPYYSWWYEWPLNLRPIFYYDADFLAPPLDEAIASFGNPLVWWSGLLGFPMVIYLLVTGKNTRGRAYQNDKRMLLFPLVAWLSMYVPWIVSPRQMTFIYHYFACTPFLILMSGILFRFLYQKGILKRRYVSIFVGVTIGLFVVYYPVLSGIPVPRLWLDALRVLPGWEW